MSYDVLVIGGGPAGLSASINVRARGRSALVVSNPLEENPLWRAEKVDNYLGLPGLSGAELGGGDSKVPLEHIAEIIGIGIPRLLCNQIRLVIRLPQQPGRLLHADIGHIGGKAHPGLPLEQGGKIGGGKMQVAAQGLHT